MSKLFKKTLLMMVLLFGVFATIISAYAGWILYDRIIEEYKSKAVAIANNIARSSIEVFLNRDASTIQSIVDQFLEIEGVSYVVVVHEDGEILSHTFAPEVPYPILGLVVRPREKKDEVIVTNIKLAGKGAFLDISSPILSGVAGHIHVGMGLDSVRAYIWRAIIKIHLISFAIFLVSVAVAFVLTNTISRPLRQLTDYADKVANRDFSAKIDIASGDEVGLLARTMTNMAAEIKARIASLEQDVVDATQELQDTLAYVSAIIENLTDGLVVVDTEGTVTRHNPALVAIMHTDSDLTGKSALEILGPEAALFFEQKKREYKSHHAGHSGDTNLVSGVPQTALVKAPITNTAEITATRPDGALFPVELSVSFVSMKDSLNTIGIVRDITIRKRAEETLRISEEKYRGIFEHAVDGIFQIDVEGQVISANPATARILGYDSPEELIEHAKDLGDKLYVNPECRDEFIRLMRQGDVVHGFEVELYRKDGSPFWASMHAGPVRSGKGELLFAEGIVEDITERKRVQEALLESEARYRELFDVSPDPMIVHRNSRILFGNKAAAHFFGVGPPSNLEGLNVIDLVHPDFRDEVLRRIQEAQNRGNPSDFAEFRFLRENGRIGFLESSAVPTQYKGQRAVLSLGRDITGRKEAEAALRSSESRFRTIFEIAPDCIYLKDRDLKYADVNPAVTKLLGVPREDVIGKRAESFFGEEAARQIREGDLRVLEGETVEAEHTRPVRGMYLTFHDIRTPLRDSSGSVVGVCKFSRNITDLRGVQQPARMVEQEYKSSAMLAAMERARQAAQTDGIVLLLGESGSGKDYIARWIHRKSLRAEGPFFSVNCAAVPRELAESEFFGHERGAFTGALAKKRGLLELAEGGTLLLNEIGELPLNLQSKLLTFLDTRSFTRVGGEKQIYVNARVIAATHRDLQVEVAQGRFLDALYYRLNVYPVTVPPLRERLDDLPIIIEEVLLALATEMRLSQVPVIDPQDLRMLYRYQWPGNIRELRNVLERAVMLSKGPKVDLVMPVGGEEETEWTYQVSFPENETLSDIVHGVTSSLCAEALRRSEGNRKQASELLGISRHSLYRYMRNYALEGASEYRA